MNTQLTASEKLQFVDDKIRELVPRLVSKPTGKNYFNKDIDVKTMPDIYWQIRLEDVLEAFFQYFMKTPKDKRSYVATDNDILFASKTWQYGKPLSGQSEEFINFLYDLLK